MQFTSRKAVSHCHGLKGPNAWTPCPLWDLMSSTLSLSPFTCAAVLVPSLAWNVLFLEICTLHFIPLSGLPQRSLLVAASPDQTSLSLAPELSYPALFFSVSVSSSNSPRNVFIHCLLFVLCLSSLPPHPVTGYKLHKCRDLCWFFMIRDT